MRKSSRVTLVLLGVAALSGCSRDEEPRRDVYASREDCLADWGNKPEDCKRATEPAQMGRGLWWGPAYPMFGGFWGSGWSGSSHSSSHSIGSTGSSSSGTSGVSRGGFGSSSSTHASSGS